MSTKLSPKNLYVWEGLNKHKQKIQGELQAVSLNLAKNELKRQDIIVKKIKKKSQPLFSFSSKARIKSLDISVFSRQMATMMSSGIPLVQSFDIVSRSTDNSKMRSLISKIKVKVEEGCTVAEALNKHPEYFNGLFVNLVEAGEKSGTLDNMLSRIATYREKLESIKSKIKKALIYPASVIIVAFLVTLVLLIFLVPQFESFFKGFGAELPFITRVVVDASEIVQELWWIILAAVAGICWTLVYLYKKSTPFRHGVERASLKLPVVGNLIQHASVARFARTLSITFAAGLPLFDALKSVASATGNVVYEEATLQLRDEIATGQSMQQVMQQNPVFPSMLVQMVSIGEESGNLEQMLSKVADHYEEVVDNAIDGFSSLIEPIIMVILGVLVGGLLIAMYMPIFSMGSVV